MAALPLTTALLVDRCIGGEDDAARELFRREQARVHAVLFRILGSNQDVDDLMQETFIQVFRSLHNYRGDARLSTWIHRIAVRVAYKHLAKRKRAPQTSELVDLPGGMAGPAEWSTAREGMRRFYRALDALSAKVRVAYVLHEVEGLAVADVAKALDIKSTTAKLRIWRARRQVMEIAAGDPVLALFLSEGDTGGAE